MRVAPLLVSAFLGVLAVQMKADTKPVVAHFRDFAHMKQVNGSPEGWSSWAPRSEIAPKFSVESKSRSGRGSSGALKIEAQNPAQLGAWRTTVGGIRPGQTYRFTAYYSTRGIKNEKR